MDLSKHLTKVTPFSKMLSAVLFVILPFVGFYLGLNYQSNLSNETITSQSLFEPGKVIVSFNPETTLGQARKFLDGFKLTYKEPYKYRDLNTGKITPIAGNESFGQIPAVFVVDVTKGEEAGWIAEFKKNKMVKYAQLSTYYYLNK